ncbi:MAG: argininosuccinate lyase [Candidatus Omnitrophota bacterium]
MIKKMWGGRFSKGIDPLAEEFTKSIHFDYKLGVFDVLGSIYHVEVLTKAGLISAREAGVMKRALKNILTDMKKGKFKVDPAAEDIHSLIQELMEKKIGKLALKLHTSRSRNDQVMFDTKLYCIEKVFRTLELISVLIKALRDKARQYKDLIVPGFTHVQHAQPVSLVCYLGAYAEMFKRDSLRLYAVAENIEMTMGSGAVAGTNIPSGCYDIKGLPYGKALKSPLNPVDSVSDRDFVIELVSALAVFGMHLSRMAEDFVIWSTKEFDFIELDESVCTGSSLMPQKKNPDVVELIRGYSGRLYGNLVNVLVMMKGLPLSYNRDMQHDKEPLFDSFDIGANCAALMASVVKSVKFNTARIMEELADESLYATDLAHFLVTKGVAFKDAHAVIGSLVKYSVREGRKIKEMKDNELAGFSKFLTKGVVRKMLDPYSSVRSKRSIRKHK